MVVKNYLKQDGTDHSFKQEGGGGGGGGWGLGYTGGGSYYIPYIMEGLYHTRFLTEDVTNEGILQRLSRLLLHLVVVLPL